MGGEQDGLVKKTETNAVIRYWSSDWELLDQEVLLRELECDRNFTIEVR